MEVLAVSESGYAVRAVAVQPPSESNPNGKNLFTMRSVSKGHFRYRYQEPSPPLAYKEVTVGEIVEEFLAQLRLYNLAAEDASGGLARLYHFFVVSIPLGILPSQSSTFSARTSCSSSRSQWCFLWRQCSL